MRVRRKRETVADIKTVQSLTQSSLQIWSMSSWDWMLPRKRRHDDDWDRFEPFPTDVAPYYHVSFYLDILALLL